MSNAVEVLVVLVNYRCATLTLRALASLESELAAPGIKLSAVVVENASGEEEALREGIEARFSGFARLVVSDTNGGFGAGNNLGLRASHEAGARPRYVHFLNPDTEARPGAVTELVSFLEEHPDAGLAGGMYEDEDGTPWPMAFRFPTPFGELEAGSETSLVTRLLGGHAVARQMGDEPAQVDWLMGASIMARREVLETVGAFDEAYFLYYEETDLCFRAHAAGYSSWYVPTSRVMHVRGGSTGVTGRDSVERRLPRYVFDSRRRYYAKNHGRAYALAADVAYLAGNAFGSLKRRIKRQPRIPYLLVDFARASVIWPSNREVEAERIYRLPRLERA